MQSLFDLCTIGRLPSTSAFLSEPTGAMALPGKPQGPGWLMLGTIYTASPCAAGPGLWTGFGGTWTLPGWRQWQQQSQQQ